VVAVYETAALPLSYVGATGIVSRPYEGEPGVTTTKTTDAAAA
jgi:hypothetical protein